jgi:hypothetical protein
MAINYFGNNISVYTKGILQSAFFFSTMHHSGMKSLKVAQALSNRYVIRLRTMAGKYGCLQLPQSVCKLSLKVSISNHIAKFWLIQYFICIFKDSFQRILKKMTLKPSLPSLIKDL